MLIHLNTKLRDKHCDNCGYRKNISIETFNSWKGVNPKYRLRDRFRCPVPYLSFKDLRR